MDGGSVTWGGELDERLAPRDLEGSKDGSIVREGVELMEADRAVG